MNIRQWLSVVVCFAMIISTFPAASVHAEPTESITSSILSVNGEEATWSLLGTKPAEFAEASGPNRLSYYDGTEVNFELVTTRSEVEAGTYQLSLELFSENHQIGAEAIFYAITSEGLFSTPLSYAGSSWEAPATLKLPNVVVGGDGEITIGIKVVNNGAHYGYVRNVWLTEGEIAEQIKVTPNSAILRPGYTVQLSTVTNVSGNIEYQSSDENIAAVSENGLVTATGNGEATISVQIIEDDEVIASGNMSIYVSDSLQTNYTDVAVEPIPELEGELRDDFIMGADISMLDAMQQIDRKFYNADGVESSLIEQLKDNGVNWIRLRSWVDPADEDGNPYGGGNIDTEALVRMAAQVKAANLKLLVDLHYSDFWTDPARQGTPKAWASLNAEQLEQQVYDYTKETLQALAEANAYPDMIQIGNETNGGMLWPLGNSVDKAKRYIAKGIEAVRDFEEEADGGHIDIVIHRANPGDGVTRLINFYQTYDDLDYDVIGLSYYPFWHGTLHNLQQVMDQLAARFERKVAIVETSYAYTLEDAILNGPTGHIFSASLEEASDYLATPQGQANAIRDVIAAVAAVPEDQGIGIFYWEPGWQMGTDTGWGTTYAEDYQNEEISSDGGSGWANQGLFNYFGEALPSIKVFQAVRAAAEDYIAPTVAAVHDITIVTSQDNYVAPPNQVRALFTDDTYRLVPITSWSPSEYDYTTAGEYTLVGTLESGDTIEAIVTVKPKNYVVNPSFESSDLSTWELINAERSTEAKFTGNYAIHFWSVESLSIKQQLTNLPNGMYQLSVQTRIGIDEHAIAESSILYATTAEDTYSTPLEVTGWDRWKQIVVQNIKVTNGNLELGVIVNDAVNDYGDFDDFELIYIAPLDSGPKPSDPPRSPGPVTSDPEPVLTKAVVNGEEVLQAKVLGSQAILTIPFSEINMSSTADIVVAWGNDSIVISREHLSQLKGEGIIITKTLTNPALRLGGARIDSIYQVISWQIQLNTSLGKQQLSLPINWTTTLIEADLGASAALYKVDAQGSLQYIRGINQQTHLNINTGDSYVIANVTRAYTDVEAQAPAVKKLTAMGLLQGNGLGQLNLNQTATRAEAAKLVSFLANLNLNGMPSAASEAPKVFIDVAEGYWAKPYIDDLTSRGWLQGVSAKRFAPNGSITFEELYVILTRMLQLPIEEVSSDIIALGGASWSTAHIQALVKSGFLTIEQLSTQQLTEPITREEWFQLIHQIVQIIELDI